MEIYELPLLGISSAQDPLYQQLQEPQAVGPQHMLPEQWLAGAQSVISFFLPFSQAVKRSNSDRAIPSKEWLYGRVEGQKVVDDVCRFFIKQLEAEGWQAVAPSIDGRFRSKKQSDDPNFHSFASNWSERHVAYVSGLGTFGLSKGLITARGVAGRFGSVITTAPLMADTRPYSGLYDYCTYCGACIKRCPVDAISIEHGKDHTICSPYVDLTAQRYAPRYGCGKCQTQVPCMNGIPKKAR